MREFLNKTTRATLCLGITLAVSFVLTILVLFSSYGQPIFAEGIAWDGTTAEVTPVNNVYSISNAQELAWVAEKTNINGYYFYDKTIKLTQDIFLNTGTITETSTTARQWIPIGTGGKSFQGIFDGNGHTVSGLYIDSTQDCQGLFGESGGSIKNVGIINSFVRGNNSVGGVVGYINENSIDNCYNEGTINGMNNVGGVIGHIYSSSPGSEISNCYNTGNISGSDNVGGVCGYTQNYVSITNCNNTGNINGSYAIGGVVGQFQCSRDMIISNSYNNGNINGHDYVGGVAGNMYKNGYILNCYNTGDVYASNNRCGGITSVVGENSSILNCYNTGKITNDGYWCGGIVAKAYANSAVTDCYNIGTIVCSDNGTGGILGDNESGVITNCYYTGCNIGIGSGTSQEGTTSFENFFTDITISLTETKILTVPLVWNQENALGEGFKISIDNLNTTSSIATILGNSITSTAYGNDTLTGTANIKISQNSLTPSGFTGEVVDIDVDIEYSFLVTVEIASGCEIIAFKIGEYDGIITETNIDIVVPLGTELTNIVPNVEITAFSTIDKTGAQDFTNSVTYRVTAENGNDYKEYIVTVSEGIVPEGEIYLVGNAEELKWISTQVNAGNDFLSKIVKLKTNIVLEYDDFWIPIGNIDNPFAGTFEGAGYTISNIHIENSSDYQGLIGFLRGTIQNVGIIDSYIKANDKVGAIAGYVQKGVITNCYNASTVIGNYNVGGIVGYNERSQLSNSYNTGDVYGCSTVGGITGFNHMSSLNNCYNVGSIKCENEYLGGISGFHQHGLIANCYNIGNVETEYVLETHVGGITGSSGTDGTISNCYYVNSNKGIGSSYGQSSEQTGTIKLEIVLDIDNIKYGDTANITFTNVEFVGDDPLGADFSLNLLNYQSTLGTINDSKINFTTTGISNITGNMSISQNKLISGMGFTGEIQIFNVEISILVRVNKAVLTVAPNDQIITYGENLDQTQYEIIGYKNGDENSVIAGKPTLTSSSLVAGENTISLVTIGMSANCYEFVAGNDANLTVNKAAIVIKAKDQVITYGDALPVFTFSYVGLENGDTLIDSATANYNQFDDVGNFTITVTPTTYTNYVATYEVGTLIVEKKAIIVTADSKTITYGDALPVFAFSYVGLENGDTLIDSATADYNQFDDVGNSTITLTPTTYANYVATYEVGALTVEPKAITVKADSITKPYRAEDPIFTFRITSGELLNGDKLIGNLSREPGENPNSSYLILQGTLTQENNSNYEISFESSSLSIGVSINSIIDSIYSPVLVGEPNIDNNNYKINLVVKTSSKDTPINITTSEAAEWYLYSDANCTVLVEDKKFSLNVGENKYYLKLISNDNEAKIYAINIIREREIPLYAYLLILAVVPLLIVIILLILKKNKMMKSKKDVVAVGTVENLYMFGDDKLQITLMHDEKYYYKVEVEYELIGKSIKYKTRQSCVNGIVSFQKMLNNDVIDSTKDVYKRSFGEAYVEIIKKNDYYYFNSIMSNGNKNFMSISYGSLDECKQAIKVLKQLVEKIKLNI